MKKQITIVALASLFASTHATELNLQLNWEEENKADIKPVYRSSHYSSPMGNPAYDTVEHIVTPAFQNAIHPEDAAAGSNPAYDIIKSGRYYLSQDFKVGSTVSGASLLRVSADNVTLDMNSKVITPKTSSDQTNLVGILVNNRDNVTIMNGTVQCDDTSGTQRISTGISLSTGAAYTVKVQDVFVNRCLATGITASSVNDISLENVSANNASGSSAVVGMSLSSCKNVKIRDCEVNNNSTSSGDCTGLLLSACEDGSVNNLIASSNVTTSTSNGDKAIGVSLASATKNIVFSDCTASNNASNGQQSSAASHSIGFSVAASPLNRFESCVANGNGDDGTNGIDNDVAGFDISGASHSCSFINCEASKNIGEDNNGPTALSAYGFKVDGGGAINNLYFENCIANANEANSASNTTSNAAGFWLAGLQNSKLVNCQAHKNDSEDLGAYGFYLIDSSSAGNMNNILVDCQAKGNTTAGVDQSAVGFSSDTGINNRFEGCIANGQAVTSTATSIGVGTGASGFRLDSETRSQVINCEAVGNSVDTDDAQARAYGFFLGANANGCIVRDSYAAYNTTNGTSGYEYGFYDNTADTAFNTLFMGNTSVGHGKCLTSVELDASNKWQEDSTNGEPVQVGTGSTIMSLNYYWKNAGTGDRPTNVIHEVPRLSLSSLSTAVKMWENVSIY